MDNKENILIDASNINNKPTGAGRYSFLILKNLLKNEGKKNYWVLVQKKLRKDHPVFELKAKFIFVNLPVIGPKRDILLSIFFRKNRKKFDIFYCLFPYLPLFINHLKSVITIHDLCFLKYPKFLGGFLKSQYFKMIIRNSVKRSHLIITTSNSTKKDIEGYFGKIGKKIEVVYGDSTMEVDYDSSTSSTFIKEKSPYFLCVSERRVHKNINGLIKSFDLFIKKGGGGYLFLVGRDYRGNTGLLKSLVSEIGLDKRVVFFDNASDKDLTLLYRNAFCFILPSFCEGFGLPLVEAMKFNIPVITSNISSMPEIVDEAGLLVDPNNIEDIANKMLSVFKSENLRDFLIEKGKKRSSVFSWVRSADKIRDIINKIL